ncbi:MAG: hypothetical protein ACLR3C_07895 [Eggerthella lenta]
MRYGGLAALAFRRAIRRIEEAGVRPDVVLLDGNPMRLDGAR